MNVWVILRIIGYVLECEGAFLLLPCMVALCYGEKEGFAFLATTLLSVVLGRLLLAGTKKRRHAAFYTKDGFFTVALSWVVLSLIGAVPYCLSGAIPSFIDALFESVSGFTTTGASILSDVESLPYCVLFFRSFTHWIGGMGVLVFILALLPMAEGENGNNIHLMRAESPGPQVGKLVPKIRETALILYAIYFGLTVLEFILLLCGGMPVFDAIVNSFATAGTGGFAVKNASIAAYSPYHQYVIAVFMLLFGVNFNVYYLMLIKKAKQALACEEVRWYFGIVATVTALITVNTIKLYETGEQAFRYAFFQTASIITTTGFATTDFEVWPSLSTTLLMFLLFTGACAGSTGGGIKISRVVILLKSVKREILSFIHPRAVKKVRMEGKAVSYETQNAILGFLATYVCLLVLSVLLLSFNGCDFTTNVTAVGSALGNVGPGLGEVGPTDNYGFFSVFSKLVLIFDMLAGRLELYPMLVLFSPRMWKK